MGKETAPRDQVLAPIAIDIDVVGGMGLSNEAPMKKVCLEAAVLALPAPVDAGAMGGSAKHVVEAVAIGVRFAKEFLARRVQLRVGMQDACTEPYSVKLLLLGWWRGRVGRTE